MRTTQIILFLLVCAGLAVGESHTTSEEAASRPIQDSEEVQIDRLLRRATQIASDNGDIYRKPLETKIQPEVAFGMLSGEPLTALVKGFLVKGMNEQVAKIAHSRLGTRARDALRRRQALSATLIALEPENRAKQIAKLQKVGRPLARTDGIQINEIAAITEKYIQYLEAQALTPEKAKFSGTETERKLAHTIMMAYAAQRGLHEVDDIIAQLRNPEQEKRVAR